MNRKKIICFGEIMLRLTPMFAHERLEQTDFLRMSFAGAESNIATALSILGNNVEFVTVVPDNQLGNAAVNLLRKHGVSTSFIRREGKRIGTYYIEAGASLRPSQVIYDRENSAIATLTPSAFDWEAIFADAGHFVITGITPALSDTCASTCLEAVKLAKKKNIKVCFDFNYRSKLWPIEKAQKVLALFLPYIDVLFCNEGAVQDILNIELTDAKQSLNYREYYGRLANEIAATASYECIAITHREDISASENGWSGILYHQAQLSFSKSYTLDIVDRFGAGDAFAAGIIHGLCRQWNNEKVIEFATAASALKHTIPGDLNIITEQEINHVLEGNTTGRVIR
jgi:2-dehydro-3-deoxygluconokinase